MTVADFVCSKISFAFGGLACWAERGRTAKARAKNTRAFIIVRIIECRSLAVFTETVHFSDLLLHLHVSQDYI
jgi:hypothetical protein